MNLFKIGDITLNMDRVSGIQDHQAPSDPAASPGQKVIRVLFDDTSIDLAGADAMVLRRWIRHNARNLAPQRGEDGEELISPEEQIHRICEHVLYHIDRARPRDNAVRSGAHRLSEMIETYITGQLKPVARKEFEREFEVSDAEEQATP